MTKPPRIPAEAGFVSAALLPKGPNGRALCRRCSTEVPVGRRTFCSEPCIHEWKIRTQPSYAKQQVKKRDDGICAICRTDCFEGYRGTRAHESSRGLLFLFDMDHNLPVGAGEGSCGLDNPRSLCRPCHKTETAKLAARRAEARRSERRPHSSSTPNETR